MLIHIITEKGHGYEPAVRASDKMHGVAKYDIATGKQSKPKAKVRHFAVINLIGSASFWDDGRIFCCCSTGLQQ